MAGQRITVVISQGQSLNPAKRNLEEDLAARLIMEPGIEVSIVPHLYDMAADHTGLLYLRGVTGHVVVLSWLYPRAARWVLDRQGFCGHEGASLLDEEDDSEDEAAAEIPRAGIGSTTVPNRRIYCIDMRVRNKVEPFLEEIRRIHRENSQQMVDLLGWVQGSPTAQQMDRYLNAPDISPEPAVVTLAAAPTAALVLGEGEAVKRRWYPVIDYSRCTNCLECIDFCLFGVYGIDTVDRILVEAQDNCKKGCPACSRVCPENAIIFPQHKSPAIAGADGEIAGLKIDLSVLFGGAAAGALETAVAERDAELVRDGRDAVGMEVGVPKRQAAMASRPKDDLDALMDGLDSL